jgi:hypothetical protein
VSVGPRERFGIETDAVVLHLESASVLVERKIELDLAGAAVTRGVVKSFASHHEQLVHSGLVEIVGAPEHLITDRHTELVADLFENNQSAFRSVRLLANSGTAHKSAISTHDTVLFISPRPQ